MRRLRRDSRDRRKRVGALVVTGGDDGNRGESRRTKFIAHRAQRTVADPRDSRRVRFRRRRARTRLAARYGDAARGPDRDRRTARVRARASRYRRIGTVVAHRVVTRDEERTRARGIAVGITRSRRGERRDDATTRSRYRALTRDERALRTGLRGREVLRAASARVARRHTRERGWREKRRTRRDERVRVSGDERALRRRIVGTRARDRSTGRRCAVGFDAILALGGRGVVVRDARMDARRVDARVRVSRVVPAGRARPRRLRQSGASRRRVSRVRARVRRGTSGRWTRARRRRRTVGEFRVAVPRRGRRDDSSDGFGGDGDDDVSGRDVSTRVRDGSVGGSRRGNESEE